MTFSQGVVGLLLEVRQLNLPSPKHLPALCASQD
jgi:hypothetical protein